MPSVQKSVLLPYSDRQMFDLVHDIESYPQFLPWCGSADVRELDAGMLEATLEIAYRGIRQAFTTRNVYTEPARIDMKLVDGPFSKLQGYWLFRALRADACKVEFTLDYAFASGLLGKALSPVFAQIAGSMVDAFVRRAQTIHG